MKRIALINQRYGKEVNGGSEYYTMQMAQRFKEKYHVDVLTSKALTYDKWEDYYGHDVEVLDGITIRRFGVKKKRNRYVQRLLKETIVRIGLNTEKVTAIWNKSLGPYVPELVNYIESHKEEYEAFIFVTYMYYPVVFGMKKVADKAIFVPTAHDEYCIYFKIYENLFRLPKRIVYLTEEEKKFVQGHFHNESINSRIIGVGVEPPESVDEDRFRKKYHIDGDYIIYAGRVDADKGCEEMFEYFLRYGRERRGKKELQLVVIGKSYMEMPIEQSIKYLGFVSEQDKYDGMKGANLLWLPSRFESLSIAVLEAMSIGTPVIVNGQCEVLKGHCTRSKGGAWYRGYDGFVQAVEKVMEDRGAYRENASRYVKEIYGWKKVMEEWEEVIDGVIG